MKIRRANKKDANLIDNGFITMTVWVLAENPSRAFYESFCPLKVKTETVSIGDCLYKEVLYRWQDLHQLLFLLKSHRSGRSVRLCWNLLNIRFDKNYF
ncbi:hypothetical protein ACF5W4_14725 [Bacillota bacterium Lsc_1132]